MEAIAGDFSHLQEETFTRPKQLKDGAWLADGLTDVEDVVRCISPDRPLPIPPGKYHTIGGMVVTVLGRIPEEGDRIPWEDFWIEVVDMDRNRVDKLRIVKGSVASSESGEA